MNIGQNEGYTGFENKEEAKSETEKDLERIDTERATLLENEAAGYAVFMREFAKLEDAREAILKEARTKE